MQTMADERRHTKARARGVSTLKSARGGSIREVLSAFSADELSDPDLVDALHEWVVREKCADILTAAANEFREQGVTEVISALARHKQKRGGLND